MIPLPFDPVPSPPDTDSATSETHAGVLPMGPQPRRWDSKRLIAGVFVFVACLAIVGLFRGRRAETVSGPDTVVAETEPIDHDFTDQVADVLAGESTRLRFAEIEISDRMLSDLPVQSLASLDTVIADQGVVTDAGAAVLAQLPGLEQLRLRHSPITDTGIAALAECQKLWLLNLPQSRLSSAGIESLQKLTQLQQLRLGSPLLDDDCCAAIAELKSLRGLHLIGVPVTDAGLQSLASLPRLESLYLDDCAVTEAGWDWLFQHHPQLHVHVDQGHHDRDPHSHSH